MEVLFNSVCMLCEEATSILTQPCGAPFLKYMCNTFFDKSKEALQEFQTSTAGGGLCALCSHHAVISHKFKDSYEDLCKRTNCIKKIRTGCFLCEERIVDLIETEKNPNSFTLKINAFMDSSLFPKPYLECMVCFDCIFYLSIWYQLHCYIQKKCQTKLIESTPDVNTTSSTRTKAQKKVHFNEDDTFIEINSCEDVSSEESDTPVVMQEKKKPKRPKRTMGPASRKKVPPSSVKNKIGPRAVKNKMAPLSVKNKIGPKSSKRNKTAFKSLLKKQLKHLKSIKQVNHRKKWPSDILTNNKIYLQVPYILLTQNQIKNKKRHIVEREDGQSPTMIEISDESDGNSSLQPFSTNKKSPGFKIKWPSKFLNSSKQKSKKQMQEPDYTCAVCDKIVISLSEFKVHALWHEKPERPVVHVTRSSFLSEADNKDLNEQDAVANDSDSETANEGISFTYISDFDAVKALNPYADVLEEDVNHSEPEKMDVDNEKSEASSEEMEKDDIQDEETDSAAKVEEKDGKNGSESTEETKVVNDKSNDKNKSDDENKCGEEDKEKEKDDIQVNKIDKALKLEEKGKGGSENTEEMNVENNKTNDETKSFDETNSAAENETNEIKTVDENPEKVEAEHGNTEINTTGNTDKNDTLVNAERTTEAVNNAGRKVNLEVIHITNDFSSDSESNDGVKNTLDILQVGNGEIDSDSEQSKGNDSVNNQYHESLIQNKKRSHEENANDKDNSINENRNGTVIHNDKRVKFTGEETVVGTDDLYEVESRDDMLVEI